MFVIEEEIVIQHLKMKHFASAMIVYLICGVIVLVQSNKVSSGSELRTWRSARTLCQCVSVAFFTVPIQLLFVFAELRTKQ